MEEPTNKELNNDIKHICETVTRIEVQVIKTNGRVSVLERWRSYLLGAFASIALSTPTILYLIDKFI